ncbi:MAG: BtpA/SgcQ family protein [Gemmataceae bacterium]
MRYRERFPGRHTVFPVIHVEDADQAYRNAHVAREAGADGVFLINHGLTEEHLLEIHGYVANAQPDWWIGVNCLGWKPAHVFRSISRQVAGVWVDNAAIDEDKSKQSEPEHVLTVRAIHHPECLYFGGVAFKFQREVEKLEKACHIASQYMDVVTTSGPGTGEAADIGKISRMRNALGNAPLAIASGITPANVDKYLPYADSFLVATGISATFVDFAPALVRSLIERVRAYRA